MTQPVELPPRTRNRLTIQLPGRLTGGDRESISDAIFRAVRDSIDSMNRLMIEIRIQEDASWVVDIADPRLAPRDFGPVKGAIMSALARLPRE